MTASTEQERAEFEVWARDRYPSIDLTRDGDDYSKALAKDYWSLWQAARRAPSAPVPQGLREAAQAVVERWDTPLWKDAPATAVYIADLRAALAAAPQPPEAAPVQQDAATHNKNLNGFIDFANQIDFAKPRSASLKRKFLLETRDAILDLFRENLKLHQKVDALSAAPQPPEADMGIPISQTNQQVEAPVQLPEPVCFALYDSQGFYEARDTEQQCVDFCKHYNERDARLGGGLAPYTYGKLYPEQQVRELLAAHGIEVAP